MLEINMDDVVAVVQSIAPQLIVIAVALVLGIIMTIAVNKKTVANQDVRKLVHSTGWIVVAIAAITSISLALTGPLNSMLTMATAAKHELTQETIDKTNELAVNIEREGITLLQNNDDMLPLSNTGNINVFGWASTNPIYGGTGSGALSDAYDTTSLLDGLHNAGFTTNEELTKFYTDYSTTRGVISVTSADWTLPEPAADTYTDELIDNAKNFSDTAMVVIGRVGGEGLDLPTDMKADDVIYNNNSTDYEDFPDGTHYLELSQSEKNMIDMVTKNFENVVLVYNGANAFELNFVEDYPQIKSVLWAPHPGQAGFDALGEVLSGETNPSGRNFEYFSEDPVLTGNLSSEQVLGAADRGVYSFIKHFALNEQETQRNGQLCTWANEQSIRELYLKPFETVIKADGDAQAVMGSFNYIGNTYSSAHTGLNQTVLRGEWDFKGFVETDYFSGANYAYQTADQAIRGGTDAMLATTETTNHITDQSATSVKAMRVAARNILYTAVNSWRYADGEPDDPMPVWQVALIVADVALGVLLVVLEVIAIRRFAERRKEVKAE